MFRDGERNTAPHQDLKEHAGSQDSSPNLVSLVRPSEDSEHPQSEAIMTVLDEMQGTAAHRCTQLIKPSTPRLQHASTDSTESAAQTKAAYASYSFHIDRESACPATVSLCKRQVVDPFTRLLRISRSRTQECSRLSLEEESR